MILWCKDDRHAVMDRRDQRDQIARLLRALMRKSALVLAEA